MGRTLSGSVQREMYHDNTRFTLFPRHGELCGMNDAVNEGSAEPPCGSVQGSVRTHAVMLVENNKKPRVTIDDTAKEHAYEMLDMHRETSNSTISEISHKGQEKHMKRLML